METKFKIGDRVIIETSDNDFNFFVGGKTGTIVGYRLTLFIVKLDVGYINLNNVEIEEVTLSSSDMQLIDRIMLIKEWKQKLN